MGIAIDTFGQYAGKAYEGQINDLSMADVTTIVATEAIAFGRAVVAHEEAKQGKLVVSEVGLFMGISVRKPVGVSAGYQTGQKTDGGNTSGAYRFGEEVSLLSNGRIWVKTRDGAVLGGKVYALPITGEITNVATPGNHELVGCVFLKDAIAGDLVLVQIKSFQTTIVAA